MALDRRPLSDPCSEVVGLLVDYLDGRLPKTIHAELERHLAACQTCVAYLRTYRSTVALLGSLREKDLPPELCLTLRAFLDRHADN